ncbi:IS66 family insertion sequence element accessory protein TnpA [Massilia scottii]|uniref:IS66 family insertion sequence element accessory protein TnpA n=1 Tax=Massilia scottii TaxID=3057166 RepID=UPI004044570D
MALRSRPQRHAQNGQSIAAFCRDEAVSIASFHIWRAKLAAAGQHRANPAQPAAFIDLGAIKNAVGVTPKAHAPESGPAPLPGVDVRIDLGCGIVLTITRR